MTDTPLFHPRSKRIHMILQQVGNEERQAMREWSRQEQQLAAEIQQQEQLMEYADGYRLQLSAPGSGSMSGGQVQHTIGFLQQVEQAVTVQKQQVALLRQKVASARAHYMALKAKVKGLESMIQKLEAEHQAALNKQEQRDTDEWAGRMSGRSRL